MPADPTANAPASETRSKATQSPQGEGNIKETFESILVAFIFAFIFRAFVVEAFVIPTGSMAPTLLGAHMRFRCADCGYRFTVNYSSGVANDDNIPPFTQFLDREGRWTPGLRPGSRIHCPNCGFEVQRTYPDDADNDATIPPVHYGDRILVLKYSYLLHDPARWDVVVFKSPNESEEHLYDAKQQTQQRYGQNYIKRLVGRPREALMILDGDIYVAPSSAVPTDPQNRAIEGRIDWSAFQIQRKPRAVQEALWRTVYDNDYIPVGLPRTGETPWRQPWRQVSPGAGWDLHDKAQATRVFDFSNLAGSSTLYFDPRANPDSQALTDWLAYDQLHEQIPNYVRSTKPFVRDLRISCDYQRQAGDGPLRLHLTRDRDVFDAEITPGKAVIRWTDEQKNVREFASAELDALRSGRPIRIEFSNLDYQVTLRVDDQTVATTGDAYQPNVAHLRDTRGNWPAAPEVRVAAENQTCQIAHLVLSRDVYYLNDYPIGRNSYTWGTPDNPVVLNDDEYFVLGDNSLISGDARTWEVPVVLPGERLYTTAGRVPKRFMLGKAFFVYWPAGYRPFSSWPGLIPNFGEMRFIH